MANNFGKALEMVLRHEGGYSNNPRDPGGATNHGVTQGVYDQFRSFSHKPTQDVRKISDSEVHDIYKQNYWDRIQADQLPAGLDYAMFDYAVNSGPAQAVKNLQQIVHVNADGVMGRGTINAANGFNGEKALISALCDTRLYYLQSLPTWREFGGGWHSRVEDVRKQAMSMAPN